MRDIKWKVYDGVRVANPWQPFFHDAGETAWYEVGRRCPTGTRDHDPQSRTRIRYAELRDAQARADWLNAHLPEWEQETRIACGLPRFPNRKEDQQIVRAMTPPTFTQLTFNMEDA